LWRQIRQVIYFPNKCIGFYTAIFIIIWLVAWAMNGIKNTHFDLTQLRDSYIWLMTQLNATHMIDSVWNSPKGISPVVETQEDIIVKTK
jgi:hypothetical protein